MDTFRKLLKTVLVALFLGLLLQLAGAVLPEELAFEEHVVAVSFWLHTGKWIDPTQMTEPTAPVIPTLPPPRQVAAQQEEIPSPMVLTQADAQAVELRNGTSYDIDVEALLQKPLNWTLQAENPTVLILHTHGTESYRNTENYREDSAYRTLDDQYNMISIGETLAQCLEEAGIRVIHDRTAYDYPSYNGSYSQARSAVQKHLQENPSLCLVVDVHRDAMADAYGNQIGYTAETEIGTAAQLMLVAGTDAGGLDYPNWEENLSVAVKLHAALERSCQGICRPLSLRTGRFNQDLFPNMVLVEVGAAGNTRQEALLSAQLLAQGIAQLAYGAVYE